MTDFSSRRYVHSAFVYRVIQFPQIDTVKGRVPHKTVQNVGSLKMDVVKKGNAVLERICCTSFQTPNFIRRSPNWRIFRQDVVVENNFTNKPQVMT